MLLVNGLKYDLLNISQLDNKGFKVSLESSHCTVTSSINNGMKFIGYRYRNIYLVSLDDLSKDNIQFLVAINAKVYEPSWI